MLELKVPTKTVSAETWELIVGSDLHPNVYIQLEKSNAIHQVRFWNDPRFCAHTPKKTTKMKGFLPRCYGDKPSSSTPDTSTPDTESSTEVYLITSSIA